MNFETSSDVRCPYTPPASDKLDKATIDQYKVEDTGAGLDDLMSQLQGLQGGGGK